MNGASDPLPFGVASPDVFENENDGGAVVGP